MSKISNEGMEQLSIIRNAINSIHDKFSRSNFYTKIKQTKNDDVNYKLTDPFNSIQEELSTISDILSNTNDWERLEE